MPTLNGMAKDGIRYTGFLYAGLMIKPDGSLRVLEFNCRFGDPETEALLPLLETDLAEILLACVEGRLAEIDVKWRSDACVSVVLASGGYPEKYNKGQPISGLDAVKDADVMVFHAGTERKEGKVVTAGGRVLAVSARGRDLPDAIDHAYNGLKPIHFERMHYRRDIGKSLDD